MADGDLAWPAEYPRTDPSEREPYPGDLSPTRKESFESVVVETDERCDYRGRVRGCDVG